jgi:hypothetical protein
MKMLQNWLCYVPTYIFRNVDESRRGGFFGVKQENTGNKIVDYNYIAKLKAKTLQNSCDYHLKR